MDAPPDAPERWDALAKAMSSTLASVIGSFESRAASAAASQDELCGALERLTLELDTLLEGAPLPMSMQHASKVLSVQKRIRALNASLASIQRRLDDIDRLISFGVGVRTSTSGPSL